MRAATLQPAAGRARRADRHPDDPRLPPGARRHRAQRGHRARLVAWHQPGDGIDGRLQDRDRQSDGRASVDLDALRAALGPRTAAVMLTNPSTLGLFETRHRGAARRGPRRRRARLHGRREHERRAGQVQARPSRLRRDALQHAQDVLDAARRRRAGRRSRRGQREARAVPALAARAASQARRDGDALPAGAARRAARRRSAACGPTRAASASSCARTHTSVPMAAPAWSR